MTEALIESIQSLVTEYGAFGIFLGALIEEIVSFIPSAAIIMFAGFFVQDGAPVDSASLYQLFVSVSIPVALGLTIGSLFVYGLAYYFGETFIRKFGKYFGITWEEVEAFENRLDSTWYDNVLLLAARSTPVVPFTIINALCGLIRWNPLSYIGITLLGSLVRGSIVGFMGWQLGSLYKEHAQLFASFEKAIFAFLVIAILSFLYLRNKRSIRKDNLQNM